MTGISSNRRQNQQRRRNHNRAGVSLLWAITMLIALCAMASLAVDFGRVKLARTQLRNACDAAALGMILGMLIGSPRDLSTWNACDCWSWVTAPPMLLLRTLPLKRLM